MTQQVPPPNARPGDAWASIGKPMTGIGAQKIRVDRAFIYIEKGGALRTDAQQVPLAHVEDVDVSQSTTQKVRGVGSIRIHVLRASGARETISVDDIQDFRQGVEVINQLAHQAHLAERASLQTQRYVGQPIPPLQQAPAPVSGDDVISQLERLGKLRDAGVVTPEEFAAKKAEMLSRL